MKFTEKKNDLQEQLLPKHPPLKKDKITASIKKKETMKRKNKV
jgi:hypothetical protein